MNLKKFLFLVSVLTLLSLFGSTTYAQYFVSNDPTTGASDGRNGLAATKPSPDDGITGPKLTLTNALAAMVAGQTVTVASTGLNYTEALVAVNKNVTIISGGTPVFINAKLQVDADFSMTGNFTFDDLDLNTAGADLAHTGGTLTINDDIFVDNATSTYSGTLVVAGADNEIQYNVNYTSGNEFPATGIEDLTVAAGVTATLSASKTINDDVAIGAGGVLALGTTTLSLTDPAAADAIAVNIAAGGGITGTGTLSFTLLAGAGINGAAGTENIAPSITVTSTAAQTLTIAATIEAVGNLTAGGAATITAGNIGDIANITNNGSGNITTAQTIGVGVDVNNITLAGSGNITLAHTAGALSTVTGAILVSGTGDLAWGANVTGVTVTGNVSLTASVDVTPAGVETGLATITFPNVPTTIGGTVSNSFSISGTPNVVGQSNDGNGLITFQAAANLVNLKAVSNTASGSPVDNTSTHDNNGNIIFNLTNTSGTDFDATTITNSSSFGGDATNSGNIVFTAGGTSTIQVTTVTNTSSSTVATCGLIDFNATRTGNFTATGVSTSGSTVGGNIIIGDAATVQINGSVSNSRSIAGANIAIGNGATATVNITGSYTNSGLSNVTFNLAANAAVAITGSVTNSGAGTTNFATLANGTFTSNGLSVSAGTVNFTLYSGVGAALTVGAVNLSGGTLNVPALNGATSDFVCNSFTMSGGTHTINGTAGGGAEDILIGAGTVIGNTSLTGGTLDLTNITLFQTNGTSITIGGASANPTFTGAAATTFTLDQPIPNVLQTVTIGNFAPVWPGHLTSANPANIPAVTQFTGGNLTIFGNLTINNATVNNATTFSGAKIYLGDNAVAASGGNFINTTGYTSTGDGRVVMSGTQAQTVTPPAVAGRYFGSFEVDNTAAGEAVFFTTTATNETNGLFTDWFYLTEGGIEGQDVDFVSVNSSVPHLVRNAGSFVQAPTFTNLVDLTYIGTEKTTALEVPATMLRNMTVATTNHTAGGAQAGWGVVTLGAGATVNGTLTVNNKQTLNIAGFTLTMAGATVTGSGDIAGTGQLALANATGVSFAGFTGYLPNITVNDGSMGNVIATSSVKALVNDLLNADLARNNGNDDTTADGSIQYQAGADAGSGLTVTFSGNGPHFGNLVFNDGDVDQTFTLGSNAVMSGNIAQAGGNINLGGFTLTHNGTTPGMTVGGTITNGLLKFVTAATTFTVTGPGTAVIGANFEYADENDNNAVQTLTFSNLSTGNLQVNGTLTLSATTGGGDGARIDIGAGRTLTAGGNVTVGSGSSFIATAGGGTGILLLDAVTAPLTYSTPAATNVANLTVADDVNLTGGVAGSSLTVGTAMNHTSGAINIGSANLILAGNYTRTAGTYTGTGYLVWNNGGAWNHGPAVTYPKLQVAGNLTLTAGGMVTIADELYLNGFTLDQTVAGVGYLTIGDADGALVQVAGAGNMATGAGEIAPTFVGQTNYLFTGASSAPNVETWPTSQATNVTLNTNAAQIVTVGASRTILGDVDLTVGTLQWDGAVTVTLTDGKTVTRRLNASKLDRNTNGDATLGGFVAGNINLAYQQTLAADVITTDIEYSIPTTINNFSLLASTAVAPNTTTVNIAAGAGAAAGYARTIAGTLSMASILNINAATTWTLAQTIPAGSTVNSNSNTTWTAGLTVNGTYNNAATSTGAIAGTGTFANAGTYTATTLTIGTLNNTGTLNSGALTSNTTSTFGAGSILNLTGDATINVPTYPVAPAVATINTPNNLTFVGVQTNNGLNLNFTGANAQTVALGANRTINNLTLNKTADQTVTISGGNITLNNVTPGVLTLTRGVLVLTDPNVLTLNPTVAAGFITALGYVRNPANSTDLAHIMGKVGVAVPVNTLGRMEWPVGSATKYRPAAITFTAGNATIAPTTIIVGHFDSTPTGTKNFPVDGGVKFADATKKLWIAGKAPYYWSFEATTSLGAAQKFDVELQGTNLQKPLENHNDLRIIRRFDGDVAVNGWYLEGAANSYSNAMATPNATDTVLVVRNIGSVGSAISQKALFTLGLPSLKPVFTATAPAAVVVAENATYNFAFAAQDQDANAATMAYTLEGTVPANATINATTGAFEFKPDYTQGSATPYNVTVRAAKANDLTSYVEYTFAITVTNVNRLPVFTTAGQVATASGKYGAVYTFAYGATDADAEAITYTVALNPASTAVGADAPAITTGFGGAVGTFTWKPTLADKLAGPFVITVTATDASAGATVTTTNFTVLAGYDRGDANTNNVVDVNDAIKILEHVVGKGTPLTAEQMLYADANTATGDGMVGALDASYVLKYIAAGNTWVGVSKVAATAGAVEFSKMSSNNGVVSLPFAISGTKGVTSIYAEADLNNANIEVGKINLRLPEGWLSATTTENGKVRIAAAGTTAINDGIFATVEVTLKDKEAAVSILGNAKLNDELSSSLTAKVREIPSEFALSQNYPNPFNPTTSIKFSVAQDAKVNLVVYDMLGQRVRTLVDGVQEAGFYTVRWDGSNDFGSKVASGIYIYRLQAGSFVSTMKMNLMK